MTAWRRERRVRWTPLRPPGGPCALAAPPGPAVPSRRRRAAPHRDRGRAARPAGVGLAEGGFVGVDVFFVISGFLFTQVLVRELDATGAISLARFFAAASSA